MPMITAHPSDQPLTAIDMRYAGLATDAKDLLSRACKNVRTGEIFQSSFAASKTSSTKASEERFAATILSNTAVQPMSNGFVTTAVKAYSTHHHLVIRPDDVWIAILTQFNLYVNANAEKLRHLFVEHEGKKHLVIRATGTRYTVDFGKLAQQMGHLIQENVKDAELRDWIIPEFSTTTDNDRIVSSVIMMATVKAYFSYEMQLTCGLPAVTLLGEKADWESLLEKAQKLPAYGKQATEWYSLLKPVLTAFVRTFEDPGSRRTKDFWQTIAHYSGGGSGPTYLSGWITAFCFFDKDGKQLYSSKMSEKGTMWNGESVEAFELDGVAYHRVDTKNIPPAYAEVNVKLDDNGEVIPSVMVAGLVGMEISHSGVKVGEHDGQNDTVLPVAGWWMFEEVDTAAVIAKEKEEMLRQIEEMFKRPRTFSSNRTDALHSDT